MRGRARRRGRAQRRPDACHAATTPLLDYPLIAIVATLILLGLVMVYSASMWQAENMFQLPATHFFVRQIIWVLAGIAIMAVIARIPYLRWRDFALPVMAATLILLASVLVFGELLLGARRTLASGSIQPSELAKIAVIVYVAAWISARRGKLSEVRQGLIPFGVLMGIVAGLVALERSFSVTIIVLLIGIIMFFVGGGDIKQLLITSLIGALVLGLLIWQSPHGNERIQEWWKMIQNPSDVSERMSQIVTMLRQGIGIGTNTDNWVQKAAVPLLWSDYLFANVGDDLGFIGTAGVVALFAALGYRGLGIALNAPDRFSGLMAIGVTSWFLVQAAIHMGASLALIPPTGVPLPFMSYGGSAMVTCMAGVGLLLSISRASPEKKAPYAHYPFGWGNRRARLPDFSRGGSSAKRDGRSSTQRTAKSRPAQSPKPAGERKPTRR